MKLILILSTMITVLSSSGLGINLLFTFQLNQQFDLFYWQCWTWFGTFVISVLFSVAVSIHLLCSKLVLKQPKLTSITSLVLFFITLVTTCLFDDKEPWSGQKLNSTSTSFTGLFIHCAHYDVVDTDSPFVYRRCILMDTTWFFGILICFLWLTVFFLVCFSYFPSSTQLSVTQLPDIQSKLEQSVSPQPSTMNTKQHCSVSCSSLTNPTVDEKEEEDKVTSRLAILPTKSLPPLSKGNSTSNNRFSEDTLCLPIHSSSATTTYTSSYHFDELVRSILQPHEEKVQLSDMWNSDLTTLATLSHTRSLDLALTLKLDRQTITRDNNHHESGSSTTSSASSRRLVIAHSCPEFSKKKIKMIFGSTKAKDDTSLRY